MRLTRRMRADVVACCDAFFKAALVDQRRRWNIPAGGCLDPGSIEAARAAATEKWTVVAFGMPESDDAAVAALYLGGLVIEAAALRELRRYRRAAGLHGKISFPI